MSEQTKECAGVLVGAFLVADALLNLYWATGSVWPAPDHTTLSLAVLNGNYSFAPPVTVPLGLFSLTGALITLARVHCLGPLGQRIPRPLRQAGALVVAAALLLRGVAGLGWVLGLGANPSTPFYRLNLLIYTPICLVMFVAAALATRSRPALA